MSEFRAFGCMVMASPLLRLKNLERCYRTKAGMNYHDWEGEYWLGDQPVHKLGPKQRAALNKQYVGFVFQQFHLLDDLTVAENLDMPLSYRDVKASQRAAMVADTVDRFGIVGKKDLFPGQLSGGQQQLVA